MNQPRIPLEVLKIESPCPADWSQMAGDDRRRFCDHCQKHVHDFTHITRSEAEELVCRSAGNLCVRFARDEVGTVITLDYAAKPLRRRWPVWAAMVAGLAACGSTLGIVKPPATPPVLGKTMFVAGGIAPRPTPPTTAPTTQPNPSTIMGEIAPR